jgi:hypothetical protein
MRPQGKDLQGFIHAISQAKGDGFQLQLSGLYLGEIENIIDAGSQRVCRGLN